MAASSSTVCIARHLVAIVICTGFYVGSASTGSRFRGGSGADREVSTYGVQSSLQESLEEVLRGGNGAPARRLESIEASLWRTFQALPKNPSGRLAPRAARYLAHLYFAKEHGWALRGLEPHGMQSNVSEVHEVSILQDKAPALVEGLLEARHSDHGLGLAEVVAMVAALERLIFDESVVLLEAAYSLNGISATSIISEADIHEVLSSYLLVFEMGLRGNLTDVKRHRAIKHKVAKAGGSWPILVEFERDATLNFNFANRASTNPFVASHFTFQDAAQIVESLAQSYGKWQNTECRQMKEVLMGLSPDGSGQVPLSVFYAQPQTADYQFTESIEYLREIGALDESARGEPTVRFANYMEGPSNCIASSSYYSVCCLSDCQAIMNDIEGAVLAPTVPADRLLRLVANMSSPSTDAPRELLPVLHERMRTIADKNGGEVPLHGRLFAQWLHHAFPNECAYPLVVGNAAALAPSYWQDGSRTTASAEERRRHVEEAPDIEDGSREIPWSEEELLILHEPSVRKVGAFRGMMRAAMQLAMLLVVIRTAMASWYGMAGARVEGPKADLSLPFHM